MHTLLLMYWSSDLINTEEEKKKWTRYNKEMVTVPSVQDVPFSRFLNE